MYGKVQYRTPIPSHVPVKVNTVTCAGKGFVTPNKHDELPHSFYNGWIIIIINNVILDQLNIGQERFSSNTRDRFTKLFTLEPS